MYPGTVLGNVDPVGSKTNPSPCPYRNYMPAEGANTKCLWYVLQ